LSKSKSARLRRALSNAEPSIVAVPSEWARLE
jgi:hypothetical protein